MDRKQLAADNVDFGRFSVRPPRRELLVDGRKVELGGRAFDVLLALIEVPGEVLSKDELILRVWPDEVVEENRLQAQISALRKVFGRDRDLIRTISGRGYQFTGDVRPAQGAGSSAALPARSPSNLPERIAPLIGRETELAEIMQLAGAHRLVTLLGPGGIGKTRLALEVARELRPRFADGVWVIELAPLADPALIPATIAAALQLTLAGGGVAPDRIAAALRGKQALLVLDNCEHVIAAVARTADALLRAAGTVSMMTTSREPLRVDGEYLYRVAPLAVPPESGDPGEDPLRSGAARLFVERARQASHGFVADARSAATIGAICRRLDGIPLAIELAAARTAALGVEDLAARLDNRLRILVGGPRSAMPRHQTLRAALDWSYDLLSEAERVVLSRLAIFVGAFDLASVSAVIADDDLVPTAVEGQLANLVAKSLVIADFSGLAARYRLLETTRAYAFEKLGERGERARLARRHAEHYGAIFERAEAAWETQPTVEWLAACRPNIHNLRAALDWATSAEGDPALAVALTVAAVPLWFLLSLIDEARARVERALERMAAGYVVPVRRAMQLHWALGWSLMYTSGPARETGTAWTEALALAERLGDHDYRLRALWGQWAGSVNNGEFRSALALAERFCDVATGSSDPTDPLVGARLTAAAMHFLGDQSGARHHVERMLERYVAPPRRSHVVRFQFDQRITARITLTRVLWLQGFADRALRTVEENIDEARALGHTLSLCNALAQSACPLAFLAGDLEAARKFVDMFVAHAERLSLDIWLTYGRCFKAMLLIRGGDSAAGLPLLGEAVEELRSVRFVQYQTTFLAALAEGSGAAGRVAAGLAAVDEALARAQLNAEGWSVAELLRIKGELVLQQAAGDAAPLAQRMFTQAIDMAREHGALAWELRATTSLARAWHRQGRSIEARDALAAVYGRFTEGFASADLRAAKAQLDALL